LPNFFHRSVTQLWLLCYKNSASTITSLVLSFLSFLTDTLPTNGAHLSLDVFLTILVLHKATVSRPFYLHYIFPLHYIIYIRTTKTHFLLSDVFSLLTMELSLWLLLVFPKTLKLYNAPTSNYFFSTIGLTIETSKMELKHFIAFDLSASRRKFAHLTQPSLSFAFRGHTYTIKPTENWRYLGFFFDSFLKFDYHIKHYTNKDFSSLRACSMLGNSSGGLGPRSRVLVFKTCVLPILIYGLPLWYAEWGRGIIKHIKYMSHVQNYAVCWITGGFKTSPTGSLDIILGIPPLKVTCNLRISQLMARIASLPDGHMLKEAWQVDQPHRRIAGLHFRRRPKKLPSDNPLQRLRTDAIKEQFFEYHEANRPGARVLDVFPDRITTHNMHHPKKGGEGFKEWKKRIHAVAQRRRG
jgi:hypothetical protein